MPVGGPWMTSVSKRESSKKGRIHARHDLVPRTINARFTLGTIAIGLLRRALPGLGPERFPRPGELRAFHFQLDAPSGGWPDLSDANNAQSIALGDPDGSAAPALLIADDRQALEVHFARAQASHPACRLH